MSNNSAGRRVPVTQIIRIFDYYFVYVMGAGVVQGVAS